MQKNIKSLDSSIATINEKTTNNNKSLKPILSLDHGNSGLANNTSFNSSAATTTPASNSKSATTASIISVATTHTTAIIASNISTTVNLLGASSTLQPTAPAAPLVYTKRAASAASSTAATAVTATTTTVVDITPGVYAGDSVSPLSSNGSSSNQTLISPMTIDNQQHRLSFPNKNEVNAALMAQQQQQNLNCSNATSTLLNGSVAGNAGSNALNANNANANLATTSVGASSHSNTTNSAGEWNIIIGSNVCW